LVIPAADQCPSLMLWTAVLLATKDFRFGLKAKVSIASNTGSQRPNV